LISAMAAGRHKWYGKSEVQPVRRHRFASESTQQPGC
jgi:hypothetical protein